MKQALSVDEAKVKLQVVLGERSLSVRELSSLGKGSIVELDSLESEPVDILASGIPVAKGEVVVIGENFGVRVTELMDGGGQ